MYTYIYIYKRERSDLHFNVEISHTRKDESLQTIADLYFSIELKVLDRLQALLSFRARLLAGGACCGGARAGGEISSRRRAHAALGRAEDSSHSKRLVSTVTFSRVRFAKEMM